MAGQVWDPDPGQNEKAAMVDDQRQVGLAGYLAPTDARIPRRHLPGGAGEQQTSQDWAGRLCGVDKIAKLRAIGHLVTEIVVTLNILPKQTAVLAAVEQLQLDRKVIADRASERILRIAEFIPRRGTGT